ncbi:glycogen debranching enzyme, partial [Vibrio astriarenae]
YGYVVSHHDEQLLISDPYAKSINKALHYHPPFSPAKSFDMPKCVVIDDSFDWQETEHPRIPREEMVLFETHVKGLTQQN